MTQRLTLFFIALSAVNVVVAQPSPNDAKSPASQPIKTATHQAFAALRREAQRSFDPDQFGYDFIVGRSNGSALGLVAGATNIGNRIPGIIPYSLYEDMSRTTPPPPGHSDYRKLVRWAIPIMQGDSCDGRPIVGTSPQMFGYDDRGAPVADKPFEYARGHQYALAEGRVFAPRKFEAIIGSEAADQGHLKLGDKFRATHGFPSPYEKSDVHTPQWTIVGIFKPTRTAHDRVLFVPLISLYAIEEHCIGLTEQNMLQSGFDWRRSTPEQTRQFLKNSGFDVDNICAATRLYFRINERAGDELLKDAAVNPADKNKQPILNEKDSDAFRYDTDGNIIPDLPPSAWEISTVLVKTRNAFSNETLRYNFSVGSLPVAAISPAAAVRDAIDDLEKLLSQGSPLNP